MTGTARQAITSLCWEVGGAAAIAAVVNRLDAADYAVADLSLPPASAVMSARLRPGLSVALSGSALASSSALIVAIGHPRRADAVRLWRCMRELCPSIGVLDHWKGLERFFLRNGELAGSLLPDRLAVPDEMTAQALARRGFPADRLLVCGHPLLGLPKTAAPRPGRRELRISLGIATEQRVYVLASERLHSHPFHDACGAECRGLAMAPAAGRPLYHLLCEEAKRENAILLLRPHPSEASIGNDGSLRVVPWERMDDQEVLAAGDRVYGLSSMLAAQAVALGIETVNVAPLLDGWHPAMSFLDEEIWKSLSRSGYFGRLPDVLQIEPECQDAAGKIAALLDLDYGRIPSS